MSTNYVRLTSDAMHELPPSRQAEVYDFAKFLSSYRKNAKSAFIPKKKTATVLDLIGTGASNVGDISVNHDKYLYDR